MKIEKLKNCIVFYNVELIAIYIRQQHKILIRKNLNDDEKNVINSYLEFEKLKIKNLKFEDMIEFYNKIINEIYNNIIYLSINYVNTKYFKTSDENVKYKISVVNNQYDFKLNKNNAYCMQMRNKSEIKHKHFLKNYSDKIIDCLKKQNIKAMLLDFIDSDSRFAEKKADDFLEKNKNRITQFYIYENIFRNEN